MENNTLHTGENAKTILKQHALKYLPQNLGEVAAQQQILLMISQVAPAVAAFAADANNGIWQKVERAELPMNQAVAQCAFQTDRIIGAAPADAQTLKAASEETLLKAWIAMDYYCYVLKADYSVHMRSLQQQIAEILLTQQPGNVPVRKAAESVADHGNETAEHPAAVPEQLPVNIPAEATAEAAPAEQPNVPAEVAQPKVSGRNKPEKPEKTGRGKSKGLKIALLAAAVLIVSLIAVFMLSDTLKTKTSISRIGTVTLESGELIQQAEENYAALSDSQKEKISNRDDLFAARAEYDSLVTEDLIGQIGKVTLESQDAITSAEESYEALSREAKNLVDNYKTLTDARKEYTRLDAAVKTAEDAIDSIGAVTLESKDAIEKARNAYDALLQDDLQKHLSGKIAKLTNAEQEFDQLYSQHLYDTGLAHHAKGEYEEAIASFDTIIADYADTKVLSSAQTAKADSQIGLAEAANKKRDYYTAMQALEAVDKEHISQEDYEAMKEKILTGLNRNRPGNGVTVDGKVNWGYCYFQITAGDEDVCFKFQNTADPTKYTMVYVRAGQNKKVNVEDGTYSIKWATGENWYDKEHHFGDDTVYRSRGTADFSTSREGRWVYYWYLDLDLSEEGFKSNPITAKDF